MARTPTVRVLTIAALLVALGLARVQPAGADEADRIAAEVRYAEAEARARLRIEREIVLRVPFAVELSSVRSEDARLDVTWLFVMGVLHGYKFAWADAPLIVESDVDLRERREKRPSELPGQLVAEAYGVREWTEPWDALASALQRETAGVLQSIYVLQGESGLNGFLVSDPLRPTTPLSLLVFREMIVPLRGAVVNEDWDAHRKMLYALGVLIRRELESERLGDSATRTHAAHMLWMRTILETVTEAGGEGGVPIAAIDRLAGDALALRPDWRAGMRVSRIRGVEHARLEAYRHELGLRGHPFLAWRGIDAQDLDPQEANMLPPHADAEATAREAELLWDLIEQAALLTPTTWGPTLEALKARRPWPEIMEDADGNERELDAEEQAHLHQHLRLWAAAPEWVNFDSTTTILESALSNRAYGAGLFGAIAVERFRRMHGELPESLAVAVQELSDAIEAQAATGAFDDVWPRWRPEGFRSEHVARTPPFPRLTLADLVDPFDPNGAPVRYVRRGDLPRGYAIYSVGMDGIDHGGDFGEDHDVRRLEAPDLMLYPPLGAR